MLKKGWLFATTLVLMLFVLSACSMISQNATQAEQTPGKQDEGNQLQGDPSQDNQASGPETNRTDQDNRAENASAKKRTAEGKRRFPFTLDLDMQKTNYGATVTLKRITFEEKYIKIEFEAIGKGSLNNIHQPKPILVDDTGFSYRYIPAEDNDFDLSETKLLTGTLVFYGKLKDDAKTLKLTFNEHVLFKDAAFPYFEFTIDLDD